MKKQPKRKSIGQAICAKVLFESDRTCCVCRSGGKGIQIHHIDENHNNNSEENLAVLCFECHTETMTKGGFGRRLNSAQVILYRNDWLLKVAENRTQKRTNEIISFTQNLKQINRLATRLDTLKDNKQYELLAIEYDATGNKEVRDKYIELALKNNSSDDSIFYLRSLQEKKHLIPKDVIRRIIERQETHKDWSQLARTYSEIGDYKNALLYYQKTITESVKENSLFSAGFYLKELSESKIYNKLFEESYNIFTKDKNLWWQIRSLEELGWYNETKQLLIKNKKVIEKGNNLELKEKLYYALGNDRKIDETVKLIAQDETIVIPKRKKHR